MKNKKINTTFVALIITIVCLVAGLFIYQFQFIEKPLKKTVESIPNASLKEVIIYPKNVKLILNTNSSFHLEEYPKLRKKVQKIVGNRRVDIQFIENTDRVLSATWQKMIFGVKEAIASKKYTQVHEIVKSISIKNHVQSSVFMDDGFLYIELRHHDKYFFRIYPVDITTEVKD